MKITQIKIDNLFGYLNHTIDFNSAKDVTLIFGLNGAGKTTILRLIYDIIKGRSIYDYLFDRIQIEFDNSEKLIILRKPIDIKYFTFNPFFEHIYTYYCGKEISFSKGPYYIDNEKKGKMIELTAKTLKEDSKQKEIYFQEINKMHEETIKINEIKQKEYEKITQTKNQLSRNREEFESSLSVYLQELEKTKRSYKEIEKKLQLIPISIIQTQRLRAVDLILEWFVGPAPDIMEPDTFKEFTNIILSINFDLIKKFKRLMQESEDRLQEYFINYHKMLEEYLENRRYQDTSKEELLLEIEHLKSEIMNYHRVGFIDTKILEGRLLIIEQTLPEINFGEVCFVIDEVKRHLNPYKEIMDSIALFKKLINNRFHRKKIDVTIDDGIIVYSKDEKEIPLNSISSGEKNLVIVFYKLIFEIHRNSFVIIDEPEISLHVAWQEEFINDLLKIQKFTEHYFLVATHSPQIICDHWDLTVGLEIDNE